jgi:iron-sulfur cluster repair protein YtfE (RIC family)
VAITRGVMEPLRAEHRQLLPHIEELSGVAAAATHATPATLRHEVARTLEFLVRQIKPHAAAEDEVLYPAVERAMRAPGATDVMRYEHRALERMIGDLQALQLEMGIGLGPDQRARLGAVLYSLHAVLSLHFVKEEELYVPLLEARLTAGQADALFEEMEQSADRHR